MLSHDNNGSHIYYKTFNKSIYFQNLHDYILYAILLVALDCMLYYIAYRNFSGGAAFDATKLGAPYITIAENAMTIITAATSPPPAS